MNFSTRIFPKPGDKPTGFMSPTSRGAGIPVLNLGHVDTELQFSPWEYEDAVAYLEQLASAAKSLVGEVRLHLAAAEVDPMPGQKVASADLDIWAGSRISHAGGAS